MNRIARIIQEQGRDPARVFVFPSQVASALWLEAALDLLNTRALPEERFIAWDRFKEDAMKARNPGKKPVSSTLRALYALDLAERNRSKGPFLSAVIPRDYADSGETFAPWIAGILPSLALWRLRAGASLKDAEDRDIAFIAADYGAFLERNSLFEPSWQKPPLEFEGKSFTVFFPDAIEDWAEYADILGSASFVSTVTAKEAAPAEAREPLALYANTRDEIRSTALAIESLISSGMRPDEIAISVPDLETIAPYLTRELSLRGIPHAYRSGSPLSSLPAGRMFALLGECAESSFSFRAVKALLLNRTIPWESPDVAEGLIAFGIDNHCVSSWKENGKRVDVWEAAFEAQGDGRADHGSLRSFYRRLKASVLGLVSAGSFHEMRERYFAFRCEFLDMALLAPEDDAVIARAISELGKLESIERAYPDLVPKRPWSFFVSSLAKTNYVAQGKGEGVSVFPYRVAAGTPFARHFVLDASQERASVTWRPLSFLRQDKRESAKASDVDASAAFLSAYLSCGASFSSAQVTFAGHSVPNTWFASYSPVSPPDDDPYITERDSLPSGTAHRSRAYRIQAEGFDRFLARPWPPRRSYLSEAYGDACAALSARITERHAKGGAVRVSASDLSAYAFCPSFWFLSRALEVRPAERDAELFDERNLGLLFHEVLKRLYGRIRERDTTFASSRIGEYALWARELARESTEANVEFKGPLAAPFLELLSDRVAEGIEGILRCDAASLDGFKPELLEESLSFEEGGVYYNGKLDRVSRDLADSTAVIIDYKSGTAKRLKDYAVAASEDGEILERMGDFQIPMYILLAERSTASPYRGSRIEEAWFASISEGRFKPIVSSGAYVKSRKGSTATRDEFEPSMKSLDGEVSRFKDALLRADWIRDESVPLASCEGCDYRTVCRFVYSVGRRR